MRPNNQQTTKMVKSRNQETQTQIFEIGARVTKSGASFPLIFALKSNC